MKVSAMLNAAKVPDQNRVIIIPTALESEFYDIDVVKQAMAFQSQLLTGQFITIRGMKFYISAQVGQKVAGKENIVGFYGPGLAFILSRYMEQMQNYDPELLQNNIDFLTHSGVKLFKNEYAVVLSQQ